MERRASNCQELDDEWVKSVFGVRRARPPLVRRADTRRPRTIANAVVRSEIGLQSTFGTLSNTASYGSTERVILGGRVIEQEALRVDTLVR